jgi:hypothetical protein
LNYWKFQAFGRQAKGGLSNRKGGRDMNTAEAKVSHEEIARRAYELWQQRGCPPGDGSEDWQVAEAELIARRYSRNGPQGRGILKWWRRVRQTAAE